jgi:epoxide hydrolase-like predicted phosphatase
VVSPFQAILDYERNNSIPPGYINFSISKGAPTGAWQRIERGEIPLDDKFYREFKADLEREDFWQEYYQKVHSLEKDQTIKSSAVPPVPSIDAETLFLTMMTQSKQPDPYMYPALQKLKASGKFKLAALSNNVIFPEGHFLRKMAEDGIRNMFEIFVGSATVGMRKPDRNIYEYTMEKIRSKWGRDLRPEDVVFLDDIGGNLKTARSLGIRTVRVILGKTDDAVRELEKVTGLKLLEQNGARPRL